MKRLLLSLLLLVGLTASLPVLAATDAKHPKQLVWPFDGAFGAVDRQSAQRGFQVYKEVCAACHGLRRVAYRNLQQIGFSEAETKALAAEATVQDGPNDDGEMFDRPGRPSDRFVPPFANEKAARAANGGAYPPDLSLIIKARHDGANYLYSLLTGYTDATSYQCSKTNEAGECIRFKKLKVDEAAQLATAEEAEAKADAQEESTPEDAKKNAEATEVASVAKDDMGKMFTCSSITASETADAKGKAIKTQNCILMGETMHYNPYFPGGQIAMAQPLSTEGQVAYEDGTKATVDQMSQDVVNFLQWAAEPEMEQRKRMGVRTMLFLALMTLVFYIAKRRIWRDLH